MSRKRSHKPAVQILAESCISHGLKTAVISPGSRNAPLIIEFTAHPQIRCISLPDERSAAYYALGIALQTQRPVALICTSGTAALNYAPAIAEAYYQQVPLVVFTADRPAEWIDQGDGQTIRQDQLFKNIVKYSTQLPTAQDSPSDLHQIQRQLSHAFAIAKQAAKGPVHLNVPLREPLYSTTTMHRPSLSRPYHSTNLNTTLSKTQLQFFQEQINHHQKILLIVGQQAKNAAIEKLLIRLAKEKNWVILSEKTSNLMNACFIHHIDRTISGIQTEEEADFIPDLLISIGGQLVSKMLKQLLRAYPIASHWQLSPSENAEDTYLKLTHHIRTHPQPFFSQIIEGIQPSHTDYSILWHKKKKSTQQLHALYLKKVKWSDLKAHEFILAHLPLNCQLHLANSTPVRYAQLFDLNPEISVFSNRGTSGIDGCTSTAAGVASQSKQPNILITGDIAFLYDSNAFWNQQFPQNLKIILINNQGGNIFRFIPGPDQTNALEPFFETHVEVDIQKLTAAFKLHYTHCNSLESLQKNWFNFIHQSSAAVLEISSPGRANAPILRNYFNFLKTTTHEQTQLENPENLSGHLF